MLSGEVVTAPLFFLSYARGVDDGYVDRFYRDFEEEIRRQSGKRREEVGFRDRSNVEIGSLWRDRLTEALGRTATFVALCSPSYYASEFCGKEWSAYQSRLDRYRTEQGHYPETLLPVIWVPGAQQPDVVREIQYDDGQSDLYTREGLQFLLRLSRYQDEYHEVLIRLARRVVVMAAQHKVPESSALDLSTITSPFIPAPVPSPRSRAASRPPAEAQQPTIQPSARPAAVRGGPRHVNFVVAAATSADMVHHRRDLQHYGPDSYDWSPYRPELEQRICVFAQNIAAGQDLTSGLARAGEIEELLDQANDANELVVLLIDVWATKLDSYREPLSRYDRRNEPTSPMMVPWSSSDRESSERYDELRGDLHQTFPRNLTRGDDLIRTEIANPEAFRRDLVSALTEAQSRVFRLRPVVRRAGGDRVTERPLLGIPPEPDPPPERGTTP